MAFAGLKKQINKANQYVTEKMGGAEGTKLDLDFMDMERKTDVTVELVEELQTKTKEFLQPNPTARAKMAAVKGISKLSGQAKSNTYPQPEGLLADCMLLYGRKLGEDSIFAQSLIEMGESLKQMADVKYSLDDNIKQNFLEPLHHLQTKDLKEVMHHRKKLQGRRLDFDCKRRRQAKACLGVKSPSTQGSPMKTTQQGSHITDDEIRSAEEKFAESLHLAQMGMFNLLENDVEQVSQLTTFAEGLFEYHQQCTEILKILVETMQIKKEEAESRPKSEFTPKTLADLNIDAISTDGLNGGRYTPNSQSEFNRIRNPNHHLYSSQQNLSTQKTNFNNNNNNINSSSNHNNFSRTKIYGSQQSLSTNSNRSNSSNSNGQNSAYSSTKSTSHFGPYNNYNNSMNKKTTTTSSSSFSTSHNNVVDPWINAWDAPPSPQPQPLPKPKPSTTARTAPAYKSAAQLTTTTTTATTTAHSSSKNFNSFNNQNAQFNNFDPWSVSKPSHLELAGNGPARSTNASPLPSPMRSPARTPMPRPSGPCCSALYDFEPENPGELGFKENDIIQLINKVDENWFEGSVNGRTGYFPQSYVQVMVPLPN